jgi:FkbM family methyltransferase
MINFVTVDSIHGKFILNRHDIYQFKPLRNTQVPHIQDEISKILDIIRILPDNAVIIDGGANIGLVSIPVAKAIKGNVYSFEPQQPIYYCLCGSIALNQLENVTAYNCALGAIAGVIGTPDINYSESKDFGDVVLEDNGKNDVVVTTIDALNFPRLDFLKLDVEKMEMQALTGGINTIKRFKPWCWVEYIRSDLKELTTFFVDLGYTVYYADDANIVASPNGQVFSWMSAIE